MSQPSYKKSVMFSQRFDASVNRTSMELNHNLSIKFLTYCLWFLFMKRFDLQSNQLDIISQRIRRNAHFNTCSDGWTGEVIQNGDFLLVIPLYSSSASNS